MRDDLWRDKAERATRKGTCCAVILAALLFGAGTAHAVMGFGGPAALNTNAASDSGSDEAPQVTTDGAGNWVAVWQSYDTLGGTIGGEGDILVSRSTNNGATWTAPAALNTNADTDSGLDYNSQVTTDGAGNWVTVWESYDTLGGTIGGEGDILVSRSTNNGATWTAPAALNTNAGADSGFDEAPQVTTDGNGNWIAVWSSSDTLGGTIGADYDILVSLSTNNGAAWTAPAALDTNATSDSGGDHYPQVTTDALGNWVAVWRSNDDLGGTIGTDQDILVSRSTNNGATWTAAVALNASAASDSGNDYDPQVTTDGIGNWVTVWWSNDDLGGTIGTDPDILVSRSTNNGAAWTAPAALNTNADTDSGGDHYPQVTTDASGNWVAVWFSFDSLGGTIGTDGDILASLSTNNGANWTAPAALNTNADSDTGSDSSPQVATDGSGNWVTVWQSNDSLGGTIGTDGDILVSVSNSAAPPDLAPQIASVLRSGASPTNSASADFTVTFSEDVTGVDTGDFAIAATGVAGASVTVVSVDTGNTRTVTVNTGTGSGTIRLDVTDDDSIMATDGDKLGDTGVGNGDFTTGEEYTVDKTAPSITVDTLTTNDIRPPLSGTVSDPSAAISVTVNAQTVPATNNGNGTWTLADNALAALAAGTYEVMVTATDGATNAGSDGTTNELTIDLAISANPAGPIQEGDVVELTAPTGTGYVWKKNNVAVVNNLPRITGATTQVLKFDTVLESDSGTYTVEYDNGAKAIVVSPPFILVVQPSQSLPGVPAAGAAGLAVLSALILAAYSRKR